MVGVSPKSSRPSNRVAQYLQEEGYSIIPVRPDVEEVLGRKCYKCLDDITEPVDVVCIFRNSDEVLPYVQEALKLKPMAIWLPLGVANEEAAAAVENQGSLFVMDRCMKREHEKLYYQS